MGLDAHTTALLTGLEEQGVPSAEQVPIPVARVATLGLVAVQGEPIDLRVDDVLVRGAAGLLTARVYHGAPGGDARGLIVYFHGGGWMTGDITLVDIPLRLLAQRTRTTVVSVGYRKAPETKFPGPAEDAYAAYIDIASRAVEFGAHPANIYVAGDSSGGNLAAVVSLMVRDRRATPPAGQILFYPVTAPPGGTESYTTNSTGYLLTADAMRHYWDNYLDKPADGENPYVSPLLAESLRDLPRALVLTAEFDPLRDEGEAYAERLREAGNEARTHRLDGTIHAFFWLPGVLPAFDTAVEQVTAFLGTADA